LRSSIGTTRADLRRQARHLAANVAVRIVVAAASPPSEPVEIQVPTVSTAPRADNHDRPSQSCSRQTAVPLRSTCCVAGWPRRPVHDPQPHAHGEAAPGGRLVSAPAARALRGELERGSPIR
jgi:hypothetical protein